jgi:hypothetical protein
MPIDNDYAWMAAAAYNVSRNNNNKIKFDPHWVELDNLSKTDAPSGFAATVFRNTATGETVISIRGTDFGGGATWQTVVDTLLGLDHGCVICATSHCLCGGRFSACCCLCELSRFEQSPHRHP